jgi:hypothetical protein
MSISDIDNLTAQFYESISFKNSVIPDVLSLHQIFSGEGLLINNSFVEPVMFTAESFIQELEAQVANGEIKQYIQRELYSKTELFGKVAQRLSVYEYSFSDYVQDQMPRGINFIQYVKIGDSWNIASMIWNDENENYQIPAEYLAGRG